ncbi:MAG TPA: SPFH domain-containing protein [Polyangiaceae bacterium]|jgi:membrane protease subunit (stomatin/prohibitin family)
MGVFDFVRNGVQEMMVARPDNLKSLIVYKHHDQNIPMYSQLTVDSDECAVFFKDGRVMGVIGPGRTTLQTQNIPFLNSLVTSFTGGQVFIAEVFFVKTAPVRSVPFGGPIGDMLDPLTSEQVQPRIFGEMSVVVVDPVKFIVGYSGQAATGDNDYVLNWIKGLFMNGVKTTLGELCENEGKSLLQAVSLTSKLAAAFVAHAPDLNDIGVKILQVGTFNINFGEEDRQRLVAANAEIAKAQREVRVKQIGVAGAAADAQAKQFALDQKFGQDSRYVKELAGSYQGYAAGQAVIGAGQGMAEHGVGGGIAGMGAQMAVGVGMGNVMAGGMAGAMAPGGGAAPAAAPTFSPGGTQVICGKCNAKQPGGKFCAECGAALVVQKKFCSGCGTELFAGAKFCPNCGTASAGAPSASAG